MIKTKWGELIRQPKLAKENQPTKKGKEYNITCSQQLSSSAHSDRYTDRDITIERRRLHIEKTHDSSKPICICQ